LALGVALAREPRLLLLDEPHAGLDADGRAVLDAVLEAAGGEDLTVLIASHELDRTRSLASREVVLTAGQANAAVRS
jgi:ABC-type sulfate/molybdate transport systems ATPase subunit